MLYGHTGWAVQADSKVGSGGGGGGMEGAPLSPSGAEEGIFKWSGYKWVF